MADSDDEFDRRRRDKFRRERNTNDYERREERSRERGGQWEERGRMGWDKRERRDNFREFDRRRERYSPNGRQDISPPMKRFRGDWEDRGGGGGGGGSGGGGGGGGSGYNHYTEGGGGYSGGTQANQTSNQGDMGPPQQGNYGNQQRGQEPDYPTQPPMMSFKQFLSSQDDNITDEESVKKYNEYKQDFRKQQINEFFLAHKEEEWFKAKYNPEEFTQKLDLAKKALRHRCDVFTKLFEMTRISNTAVDYNHCDTLIKLLDAAVILMEGGSELDMKILDQEAKRAEAEARRNSESQSQNLAGDAVVENRPPVDEEKEDGEEEDDDDDGEIKKPPAEPVLKVASPEEKPPSKPAEESPQKAKEPKKKRRDYDYESGSDSESGSVSDSESETGPPPVKEIKPPEASPEKVVPMEVAPEGEQLSKKEVTQTPEEKEEEDTKKKKVPTATLR